MYGILIHHPGQERPWGIDYFATVSRIRAERDAAQIAQRHHAVEAWAASMPGVTPAEVAHCKGLAEMLPDSDGDLGYLLSMACAHLRLPPPLRRAREAGIERLARAHLPVGPLQPCLAEGVADVVLLATLVPDAALDQGVPNLMAKLHTELHDRPEWNRMAGWVIAELHQSLALMRLPAEAIAGVVISALFTRPWARWQDYLALLQRFAALGLGRALVQAHEALDLSYLIKSRADLLVGVMEDCLGAQATSAAAVPVEAIVRARLAEVRADDVARAQCVMAVTLDATRAGAWFGDALTPRNQAVAAAYDQQQARQSLQASSERLAALRTSAAAATPARVPAAGAQAPADLDPVHTWSVRRLVQWIGGDVKAPAPRRIDRAGLLKRENEQRRVARTAWRDAPAPVVRDLTATDIDLTVQDGLTLTASFLLGELDDMVYRARLLGVDAPLVNACNQLLGPLKALAAGSRRDDVPSRALLSEAEQAVARLRGAIKVSTAEAQLRQRFARQLHRALLDEALVEGKRHGGVIGCPLRPQDWAWVSDAWHQRWLRTGQLLHIDGATRQLRSDEALGLYVTGRSLSGYLFDVSVHLWQRKASFTGAPALDSEPFSPMNTEGWVDTLVPCAVLHVEAAR